LPLVLDALEFTCWNGEVVRLGLALDCHDSEAISWAATTAGISGEIIRDMMVHCVEQRFAAIRAPHSVQWLSDNGSIFAAHRTIEIALGLSLVPGFRSPALPIGIPIISRIHLVPTVAFPATPTLGDGSKRMKDRVAVTHRSIPKRIRIVPVTLRDVPSSAALQPLLGDSTSL
jgi:transposase InsO family protein